MRISKERVAGSFFATKRAALLGAAVAGAAVWGGGDLAKANLTIIPAFDTTITSDANAAAIEAGINAAISRLEADIANPVTVNITFQEGGGLGGSSTFIAGVPYASYKSAIATNQVLSPDDVVAQASLPASTTAVTGNSTAGNVIDSLPLFRALSFSGANPPAGSPDSTITLNTSIMNISRTGAQNASFYDLQAVAGHEMDEVLGAGGPGTELPTLGADVGPEDLYRFSAPGVRSFTTSTSAKPYFSINGGVNNFVFFNQADSGSDYADWGNAANPAAFTGNTPPQIQDAFGTPGVDINVGPNELAALDVIGWNLTPAGLLAEAAVPEPATFGIIGVGVLGLLARRRRRAM